MWCTEWRRRDGRLTSTSAAAACGDQNCTQTCPARCVRMGFGVTMHSRLVQDLATPGEIENMRQAYGQRK